MQINPVAFHLFGVPVFWYGIMISLGMLLGLIVTLRRTNQYGISEDRLINFLLLAVPLAIAGARFVFVVLNWDTYGGDLFTMLNIRGGGLSIHGGILGGVLAAVIYTWRTGINFWRLADLCAPGLVLGQAIGRWGNFFNQEAYGIETSVPWAMFIDGAWRHPTFLYEFIWNLLVFAFLIYISRKEKTDGAVFIRYLIWYSAGRYWIEGVRADAPFWGNFRAGQIVSLILIHGGLIVLWWRKRQARKMEGGITP
ncbi:MAG: prolipoprotein diacylglyceryl transferase [Bacillota bacterium]|nr:prolipoprotein diacylglyceryl transferase [Bacillota bacterium]